MSSTTDQSKQGLIGQEEVARWLVFSSFWGFIFHILAFLSMLISHRRQPAPVNAKPALTAMALHTGAFTLGGSIFSAYSSFKRGKSGVQNVRDRIADGTVERIVVVRAIGAAVGAVCSLLLAVGSIKGAEQITEEKVFPEGDSIDWGKATVASALSIGTVAAAVGQIAAWVVKDTRQSIKA